MVEEMQWGAVWCGVVPWVAVGCGLNVCGVAWLFYVGLL